MTPSAPTLEELRAEAGRLERLLLEVHLAAAQHLGEAVKLLDEQYRAVLNALAVRESQGA